MVISLQQRLKKVVTSNKAYFAWIMATLFYLYQYAIRVSPGIMIEPIREAFGVNAEQFATLGSINLFTYALLQIPAGILMDRIGARRIILVSVALCSLSTALSAYTNEFWVMQIGRIIAGVGSAAGFMSGIKIVVDNFKPGNRALLMGATLSIGTGGAWLYGMLFGGEIYCDWRQIFKYLAIAGGMIFILSYFLITPAVAAHKASKIRDQNEADDLFARIIGICKNPNIMIYAMLAIGLYSPLSTITDLWGKVFLKVKFGIGEEASQIALLPYLGMAIGAILLPRFCEKHRLLDWGIIVSCFALTAIFSYILYTTPCSHSALWILLLTMGFLCGSDMICFTAAVRSATADNSGLIIGVVNTLNMVGGAILQQVVGTLLDARWNGAADIGEIRSYSADDFTVPLSSLIFVFAACSALSLFLKRKD